MNIYHQIVFTLLVGASGFLLLGFCGSHFNKRYLRAVAFSGFIGSYVAIGVTVVFAIWA